MYPVHVPKADWMFWETQSDWASCTWTYHVFGSILSLRTSLPQSLPSPTSSLTIRKSRTHKFMDNAIEIRAMCRHFRVLIIGRANSGKTTILKKVCQTTDEPRIYDSGGKEVCCRIISHWCLADSWSDRHVKVGALRTGSLWAWLIRSARH